MAIEPEKPNLYQLMRQWHDFAFENPDKIKSNLGTLYFHILDQANRFGWKNKFGLPTRIAMEATGIKSYNTYIDALNHLIDFGFVVLVEKSKNQNSANIVSLSKFDKATDKALDRANISEANQNLTKHLISTVQSTCESTCESTCSVDIQENKIQENKKTRLSPELEDRVKEATNHIAKFFGIGEIAQSGSYIKIANFCRYQENQGRIELLAEQFTAYRKSKEKEPQFIHNWKKWIGSPENSYEDGVWNEQDWTKKVHSDDQATTTDYAAIRKKTLDRINQI